MTGYRYRNLTFAVQDKRSPLRRYLLHRFSHLTALQRDYRTTGGTLRVRGGTAEPATVGAAFDLGVRFLLDPTDAPTVAMIGFGRDTARLRQVEHVIETAQRAAAAHPTDQATLGRAAWTLALTTDVYRVGLHPSSPLARLIAQDRFTASALLDLAPADALRQLGELNTLAETNLFPHLSRPVHLGPTFVGSRWCAADADLIAGDLLIDIKTRLGPKNSRTGIRSDRLARADVYQLLAYALFDYSDAYRIRRIGLYSARYGRLATWSLAHVMETLAGESVDLAHERAQVWRLLGAR